MFKSHLSLFADVPVRNGQFVLIAGRKGHYKTTLLRNITAAALLSKLRVTHFTTESLADREALTIFRMASDPRMANGTTLDLETVVSSVKNPHLSLTLSSLLTAHLIHLPITSRPNIILIDDLLEYLPRDQRAAAGHLEALRRICIMYGVTIIATIDFRENHTSPECAVEIPDLPHSTLSQLADTIIGLSVREDLRELDDTIVSMILMKYRGSDNPRPMRVRDVKVNMLFGKTCGIVSDFVPLPVLVEHPSITV